MSEERDRLVADAAVIMEQHGGHFVRAVYSRVIVSIDGAPKSVNIDAGNLELSLQFAIDACVCHYRRRNPPISVEDNSAENDFTPTEDSGTT